MIYLIGVQHWIQREWSQPGPDLAAKFGRFKKYMEEAARSNVVSAIAEETSQELEELAGKKSIARLIAERADPPLLYVPCDPNSLERRALGIPTAEEIVRRLDAVPAEELNQCRDAELLKYFPLRESFWIEQLKPLLQRPVLLVCGANHIPTFSGRLVDKGIPYEILSFDWVDSDDKEYGVLPPGEKL